MLSEDPERVPRVEVSRVRREVDEKYGRLIEAMQREIQLLKRMMEGPESSNAEMQ